MDCGEVKKNEWYTQYTRTRVHEHDNDAKEQGTGPE